MSNAKEEGGGAGGPGKQPPNRDAKHGIEARNAAVRIAYLVLDKKRTLDDALDTVLGVREAAGGRAANGAPALDGRDRGFARLIATTVLRRHGQLEAVLRKLLAKGYPDSAPYLRFILLCAAAQLLFLGTPPHAAIAQAVDQVKGNRQTSRFRGLANAVLRRLSREGDALLAETDPICDNFPPWLWQSWCDTYGDEIAAACARASLEPAALDVTPKPTCPTQALQDAAPAVVLATGTVRLKDYGVVENLPGYSDGDWWVQDAASGLAASLLGDVQGLRIADLCAAPGGKTAQLAATGAHVTAVDVSRRRLERLETNLKRLGLMDQVTTVCADVRAWTPEHGYDGVLLDAPCTATGTLRRHPDILHLRGPGDVDTMAKLQADLLAQAFAALAPGGVLVYAVCSLQPQEGPMPITRFLEAQPGAKLKPITSARDPKIQSAWIDENGCLRTRPDQLAHPDPAFSGMDGFFAARIRRVR